MTTDILPPAGFTSLHKITYRRTGNLDRRYQAFEYWWDVETQQTRTVYRADLPALTPPEFEFWKIHQHGGVDKARQACERLPDGAPPELVVAVIESARLLDEERQARRAERAARRDQARARAEALRVATQAAMRAQSEAAQEERRQARLVRRGQEQAAQRAAREQARNDERARSEAERQAAMESARAARLARRAQEQVERRQTADVQQAARVARQAARRSASQPPLDPRIQQWLDWLTVGGKSPATVDGYRHEIGYWLKTGADIDQATTASLTSWLVKRRADGAGPGALKRNLSALRSLFNFLRPKDNPAKGIPWPQIKRRRQRVLSPAQASTVLSSCDTSSAIGCRDLAILMLGLDSGLRNAELCRLKLADLDLQDRSLSVIIKGGYEGQGVFSDLTAQALARWLDARSAYARADCKTVFCSVGGDTPGRPLTAYGLRLVCKRASDRSGVAPFSPHALRRSMATISVRLGMPARVLMAAGRWQDERQILTYTQDISAKDAMPYSPVESILKDRTP